MAEIFIYLFTAMLRDINCQNGRVYGRKTGHKTDVPAIRLIREQEHFCRNVMVQSECPSWVRQTWSSLIPVRRSIIRTAVNSSWERVCCLISKQDVTNTNGHFNRMVRQCTQHVILQIIWRKRRFISSSLTCGSQTSSILILLTMLFRGPSAESTTDENLTQWKNWSEW